MSELREVRAHLAEASKERYAQSQKARAEGSSYLMEADRLQREAEALGVAANSLDAADDPPGVQYANQTVGYAGGFVGDLAAGSQPDYPKNVYAEKLPAPWDRGITGSRG